MKKILSFTSRKISRALFEYEMVRPDDRILTAVSGGKDSMILSYYLNKMMKSFPVPFKADFIHIRTEFSNSDENDFLKSKMEEWDIPLIEIPIHLEEHLKPGKSMSCYHCASIRRKTLLNYAALNRYDSLALGHHMDDILESVLMNMVFNSELSAMVPHLLYENGSLRLIRPLSLLSETHLQEAAEKMHLIRNSCQCPHEGESRRKDMRKALDFMTSANPSLKNNMFHSLSRLKTEFLPQGALKKVYKRE